MSTFACEVVPVELTPHPNADQLSIAHVYGYPVIVRTDQWQGKDRGVYIPVDAVVPNVEEFDFLEGHFRIRAKKLRGVFSQGLLIPAPDDAEIGDDYAEAWDITKYEPPEKPFSYGTFADFASPPSLDVPKYTDIEHLRRYAEVFDPGEQVVVTEKIHGASAKYVWCDDKLHVASMNNWRKNETPNPWWAVVTPEFTEFVKSISPLVVYGEVYGAVQDLRYGLKNGEVKLAVFDIFNPESGTYLNDWTMRELCRGHVETVPEIWQMPFDLTNLENIAEQDSVVGGKGHIMEGLVVRPLKERWDERVGRVVLKLHAKRYLLRKEA